MRKINLSIPTPCHQDWENMTQAEQGKFCGSCQKTVMDFTNMSDRQLAEFFKKPAGSVCGRFQPDQLERDITILKKRIPWVKYFFQFAIPAFLISMKASAQKRLPIKGDTIVCSNVTMGMVAMPIRQLPIVKEIHGTIHNQNGEAVPFASVNLKGETRGTRADGSGKFKLSIGTDKNTIVVSALGYEIVEIVITSQKDVNITLATSSKGWLGEVVITTKRNKYSKSLAISPITLQTPEIAGKIVNENGESISYATITMKETNKTIVCDSAGNFKINFDDKENILIATAVGYNETEVSAEGIRNGIIVMTTKVAKLDTISIMSYSTMGHTMIMGGVASVSIPKRTSPPVPFIKRIIDSAFSRFSVYPNPVQRGSSIKIDLKKIPPGTYMLSVVNGNGSTVQNKEIIVATKNEVQNFNLREVAAGTYFIRLSNKTTEKSYTEKIIIE